MSIRVWIVAAWTITNRTTTPPVGVALTTTVEGESATSATMLVVMIGRATAMMKNLDSELFLNPSACLTPIDQSR